MDIQSEQTSLPIEKRARQMSHAKLAEMLRAARMLAAATPMALSDDEGEEALTAAAELDACLSEAADRLAGLSFGQQLAESQNCNYTDAQLSDMPAEKLADMLETMSLDCRIGDIDAPVNLSVYGDGCLERRVAKECARRLRRLTVEQRAEEDKVAFVRTMAAEVKPYRPK